jgi:thymidylate kinase
MPDKIIHTSEIQVLTHLLCVSGASVIVYDPQELLCVDDENHYPIAARVKDLKGMLVLKGTLKTCIVNCSKEPLQIPEASFIIEFNSNHKYDKQRAIEWQYIQNPTGTIRWIYPSSISKPWFLSFYNFTYWKAALYKFIVQVLFAFRLTKLMSNGKLVIHASQETCVEELMERNGIIHTQFSIFSGTMGPNRKIILAFADGDRISHFYKIALNDRSKQNIYNEYNTLKRLNASGLEGFKTPEVVSVNDTTIRLSNIRPAHVSSQHSFNERHALFLNHLYELSIAQRKLIDLPFLSEACQQLARIKRHPKLGSTPFAASLYSKLNQLYNSLIIENPSIPVGLNHGDFTRWNCYQDEERIYVYDWELSKDNMPLLYDLFHYVIQGSVYAGNANHELIQERLQQALSNKFVERMVAYFGIDSSLNLQLYLLQNATYYLDMYLNQQSLHKEALWLFKTWGNLLKNPMPNTMEQPTKRKLFLKQLFQFLLDKKYVMLKNAGKVVDELSYTSDVDLLIDKQDLSSILKWVRSNDDIQKVKLVHKSFMSTVQLFFDDNSFLSLDLLNDFRRKSIRYINPSLLLEKGVLENGVKILPAQYDYLYIFLFYQINYSSVPEKYAHLFQSIDKEKETQILEMLKENTGYQTNAVSETFSFSEEKKNTVYDFLKKKGENNLLRRMARMLVYFFDSIREFVQNRGVMLTFSGVDGAGKSTILGEVKEMLEKKYRKKVVVIRHRPSMLPILSAWKYGKEEAEQRCVDSLPRKGNNKSRISSLLRFGYYYCDYLFGQFIVYVKYILRGYIVLYDRYYFDFIVDGKRSNIVVNKNFIKGLYRLVYKPELNVFLYAQPEVILKRKKELSAEDITQLTTNYKYLFTQLGDKPRYMCIENIDKAETLTKIEQAYIKLN